MFNWLFGNKKQQEQEKQPLSYTTLLTIPLVSGDKDDSTIISRLQKKHPEWSKPYTETLIRQYKRFLHTAANCDTELVPTKDVDEVWHEHILFTKDYFVNWKEYLGKLVHHNPEKLGENKDYSKLFENTQKQIEKKKSISKTTVKIKPKKLEKKKSVSAPISHISNPSSPVYDNPVDYFIMGQMMQQECPSESHPSTSDSCVESSPSSCSSSPASSCSSSSCSSSSCSSSSCGGGGGD